MLMGVEGVHCLLRLRCLAMMKIYYWPHSERYPVGSRLALGSVEKTVSCESEKGGNTSCTKFR
jgi:hypothetical protein